MSTAAIPVSVIETVLSLIVPFLLPILHGDRDAARRTAWQMLAAYKAASADELLLVGEIVHFSLQAMKALADAAEPDLSFHKLCRHRSAAVSLQRAGVAAQRKLDVLRKAQQARWEDLAANPGWPVDAPHVTPPGGETDSAIAPAIALAIGPAVAPAIGPWADAVPAAPPEAAPPDQSTDAVVSPTDPGPVTPVPLDPVVSFEPEQAPADARADQGAGATAAEDTARPTGIAAEPLLQLAQVAVRANNPTHARQLAEAARKASLVKRMSEASQRRQAEYQRRQAAQAAAPAPA